MSQQSTISSLNRSLQDAEAWLDELAEYPPFRSEQQAYAFFRAVIHSVRDRMNVGEAAHFASQMPTLVRGIDYEGWKPALAPNDERDRAEFLASVRASLGPGMPADAAPVEEGTRAVLAFLETKFDAGQIRHVREQMPGEVQALWPSAAEAAVPADLRKKG